MQKEFRNPEKIIDFLENKKIDIKETVRPVIIAGGAGSRALKSGLKVDKNLVEILGKPAILHVLEKINKNVKNVLKPIVVVSPKNKEELKSVLDNVEIVVQKKSLGTGDAVYSAIDFIGDCENVLVVWGSQAVILGRTYEYLQKMHSVFKDSLMTLPTTVKKNPYAPLVRDAQGRIVDSVETHLEGAQKIEFGEENVGLFMLRREVLVENLNELHEKYYNGENYDRIKGELGFPNEMIRKIGKKGLVVSIPICDFREQKGIKVLDDVKIVERYIEELNSS